MNKGARKKEASVDRRIGGLEMVDLVKFHDVIVDRRIGGLENARA